MNQLQKKPINQQQAQDLTKELMKPRNLKQDEMKENLVKNIVAVTEEAMPTILRNFIGDKEKEKFVNKSYQVVLKTADDERFEFYEATSKRVFYVPRNTSVVWVDKQTLKTIEAMERTYSKFKSETKDLDTQLYNLLLKLRTPKKIVEQFPELSGLLEEKETPVADLTNLNHFRHELGLPTIKNENE